MKLTGNFLDFLITNFTLQEILLNFLFATLGGVIIFLQWRYGYIANSLYNFLKSNYSSTLEQMTRSKSEFAPYEWSVGYYSSSKNIILGILKVPFRITKFGIMDQFRVLRQIEQINPHDSKLINLTHSLRNSIILGLFLIYGSLLTVISLVVLYIFIK